MQNQHIDYRIHGQQFRAQRMARWVGTYRALTQTEFWSDETGHPYLIDDMALDYKREVLDFLEERIPVLHLDFIFGRALSDPPGTFFTHDAQRWAEIQFDEQQLEIFVTHPAVWFDDLPLVKRLRFDIQHGIGGTESPDRAETSKVMNQVVASLN